MTTACVSSRAFALRLAGAVLIGAIFGGLLGYASAQETRGGQLDTRCAAECQSHGYEAEFCGQACWIPDPDMAARGSRTDWQCMADCRTAGGDEEGCRLRCRRR